MKIRFANSKDLEDILRLVKKLYGERILKNIYGSDWKLAYSKLLEDIVVAEDRGLLVGFASFDIHENSIYLADLFVLSEFRRKGIATKLLNFIQKIQKIKNKKYLRVDVRKKDLPAIEFYKNFKFFVLEPKNKDSWRLIK